MELSKFAGPLAQGVLDLVPLVVVFGSRDVYIPPPFPGSPGALQLLPTSSINDRHGLFGPLLADFLGHRISIEFLVKFRKNSIFQKFSIFRFFSAPICKLHRGINPSRKL